MTPVVSGCLGLSREDNGRDLKWHGHWSRSGRRVVLAPNTDATVSTPGDEDMSAITHDLLQRDTGLPEPVRQALNEYGRACNLAAIAVNQAFTIAVQYTTAREMRAADDPAEAQAGSGRPSPQAQVIVDLEAVADNFHTQTLVALARVAASYAAYATQVAVAAIAGEPLPLPGSEQIRPSDLIAALDHFVPQVRFLSSGEDPRLAEQNDAVRAAHEALRQVISHQLWGHNAQAYDDLAAVRAGADQPQGITEAFPETLHRYAATVAWALGVVMGLRDEGDAG